MDLVTLAILAVVIAVARITCRRIEMSAQRRMLAMLQPANAA
jgi:hypothetical protein